MTTHGWEISASCTLYPLPVHDIPQHRAGIFPLPLGNVRHDIPDSVLKDGHLHVIEDLPDVVRVRGAGLVHEQGPLPSI